MPGLGIFGNRHRLRSTSRRNEEAITVHGNFTFLMRASPRGGCHRRLSQGGFRDRTDDPGAPVYDVQQQIDGAFGRARLFAMMTNLFGALALLLSGIGLYGLLSSSVTQRTGEMGVRLALGAPRKSVQWMILKEAFVLLVAGVVLGGILLYTTVRFIQGMLYRIWLLTRLPS